MTILLEGSVERDRAETMVSSVDQECAPTKLHPGQLHRVVRQQGPAL